MDLASIFYLGVTFGLFVIFVPIIIRTYSKKRKDGFESEKNQIINISESMSSIGG